MSLENAAKGAIINGNIKKEVYPMLCNYHTHTKYCGHAHGETEEYIQEAVASGLKVCGFSDHAPFAYPEDNWEAGHRVDMKYAPEQMEELKALREKYKGQIEIPIGYEMEYYPAYFEHMLKTVKDFGAEYLILGQHFYYDDRKPHPRTLKQTKSVQMLASYVDIVCEAMKTGVFTYVAHPDIVWFTGSRETYRREMTRLCLTAKETGTPLEINLLGILTDRFYPHKEFWKLCGEIGCKVCIGIDAHGPERFAQKEILEKALKMVEKYHLELIDEMELKKI